MNYKSLNSAILSVTNPQPKLVKEDIQTPQRKAEGEKDIKNLTGTYKRRIKKAAGIPNPHVPSNASDDALERANDALTNLSNRTAKHETERRSTELYGHRGKIIKKKATVKEDYQTRERDRQMANTGQLGSALDSKEKASKKVYGKDGVVAHKSLRSMIKKANWKDEKNRLAVKEDIQTPQRKAEGEKDIKNLSRTRTRRLKSWTKHPNPGSSGYYDAEDRFDKANSAKAARQDQQSSEQSSSDTYGKGGKIVKKGKVQKPIEKKGDYVYSHYRDATITKAQALKDSKSKIFNKMGTVKEEQEYIELLEFALEAIAEELECSVEDLIENSKSKK